MPPYAPEPLHRERMTHRVRALTTGAAILATAATVGLTVVVAAAQADAETTGTGAGSAGILPQTGPPVHQAPTTEALPPAGSSGTGGSITSPSTAVPPGTTTAPRQQLTPVAPPTRAVGRSHSGSGGS